MDNFNYFDDPIEGYETPEYNSDNDGNYSITEDSGYELNIDHSVGDDELTISEDDLNSLEDKASDIDRSGADKSQISFGLKMCPSRHGCQGATDFDYNYVSYPR